MSRVYRWKMPLKLGGRIYPGVVSESADGQPVTVTLDLGDDEQMTLPASMLTQIRPAQPVAGFVFVLYGAGELPQVFRREVHWQEGQWWHHDAGEFVTWDQVCELGEPRTLTAVTFKTERGECPVCRQERSLRVDGTVKQHQAPDSAQLCEGTGMTPKEAP